MNEVVDLDVAVQRVAERMPLWASAGITVRPVTWRDQGEGWPPPLKTNRSEVMDADSIGVVLKKGEQEGEVVLFKGGWCDYVYWTGEIDDEPVQDAPGYPDTMTADGFGQVLDRLTAEFH
ncbi:MAG: hypothetical protein ACRDZW_04625 [Acidimicrobiales bacterium]